MYLFILLNAFPFNHKWSAVHQIPSILEFKKQMPEPGVRLPPPRTSIIIFISEERLVVSSPDCCITMESDQPSPCSHPLSQSTTSGTQVISDHLLTWRQSTVDCLLKVTYSGKYNWGKWKVWPQMTVWSSPILCDQDVSVSQLIEIRDMVWEVVCFSPDCSSSPLLEDIGSTPLPGLVITMGNWWSWRKTKIINFTGTSLIRYLSLPRVKIT